MNQSPLEQYHNAINPGDIYTLWRKESAPNENLFVEIQSTEGDLPVSAPKPKNNAIAVKLRENGNTFFVAKKYHEAIARYNESISYAENDSLPLAYAYGNRSSCFHRLKMYQECLNDIKLARDAGYPLAHISKLNAREQNCMEAIAQPMDGSHVREPILDFAENQNHPGVADCLNIAKNSKYGRHVVTNRALKIGQTILIEQPFAFKHEPMEVKDETDIYDPFVYKSRIIKHDRSGKNTFGRCFNCYVECGNLIPCKKCAGALFCNEACMAKAYHKFDCMTPDHSTKETFGLVLRMLYRTNDAFSSVDELMNACKVLRTGANMNGLEGDQKMFSMIFQLPIHSEKQWSRNLKLTRSATCFIFDKVIRIPEFSSKFTSLEHRRFLKHLILHLFHVAEHAINASEYSMEKDSQNVGAFSLRTFGNGMYPFGSYMNHSCTPNVCWYFVDHRLICRVIRPIKKGDQLFGSYYPGTTVVQLYDHIPPKCRGLYLEYHYFFECKCAICSNPNWTPFSRQDLDKHPLYQKGIEPTWMSLQEIRQLTPDQLSTYEKDAAKFLEEHDRLHPVQATMMMQHNLHMLWNTFASRR